MPSRLPSRSKPTSGTRTTSRRCGGKPLAGAVDRLQDVERGGVGPERAVTPQPHEAHSSAPSAGQLRHVDFRTGLERQRDCTGEAHFAGHGEVDGNAPTRAEDVQAFQRGQDRGLGGGALCAGQPEPQCAEPETLGADLCGRLRHASGSSASGKGMAPPACAVTDHCSRHGAIGGEGHSTSGFPLWADLHNGAGWPAPQGIKHTVER